MKTQIKFSPKQLGLLGAYTVLIAIISVLLATVVFPKFSEKGVEEEKPIETVEPTYVPALTTQNSDSAKLPVTMLATQESGFDAVATNEPSPSIIGGFGEDLSEVTIPITVNNQLIEMGFTLDRYSHYDLIYATTEVPTVLTLGKFEGFDVEINGVPMKSGESCSVQFTRLCPSQAVEIRMTELETGDTAIAYINSLHSEFNIGQVTVNNPEKGFYYLNDTNFAIKMDTDGETVFYRYGGGGFDFHRTEVDGKVYYSYIANSHPAKAVVLDENYNLIEEITAGVDVDDMVDRELDTHDFQVLGENHYLYFCYFGQIPTNTQDDLPYGPNYVTAIIQEVKDGELIFHWDSSDHPEYYPIYNSEVAEKDREYYLDYVHANSLFIDPKDNNLIVSFRNIDTVSKIDRETGEIIWNLGGMIDDFGLTEDQKFSYQHHATLNENGDLTLFNNDNGDGTTSVMRFRLDEENMCVTDFEEYIYTDGFAGYLGSAQWLGDQHLLICWGGRSTPMPVFSEMNFETGEIFFEFDRITTYYGSSYRVYKDVK